MNSRQAAPGRWTLAVRSLSRPYRVTASMVVLVALVPLYIFIAEATRGRRVNVPELSWDRLVPLQPAWALVYGSLYLYLILLPIFLVREQAHIRRTVQAYLMVWGVSYAFFLAYPTIAPRPPVVFGGGFAGWGLRFLYEADPQYNCFPSLHVAHSFVSALTCHRVHRGVGCAAVICASLIGVSTLYTKQHYILDVVAGILLACLAHVLFLRRHRSGDVPGNDRHVAPVLALGVAGIVCLAIAVYWVAYELGGEA